MTTTALAFALALWGRASSVAALSPGVVTPPPAAPPPSAPPPGFAKDVAPILDRWCVSCHGEKEAQAGLRLDSYEAILKGGDDGPVVVPGDVEQSQLLAQVERRARPAMPPKKRLPRDPVAVIRAWIASGAGP
ncbi:MAG TPA: c-type cytochrome domain-containing protein [Polyangia bacterium]|nr:c-type cytochrome domain-containing protein [Polyangia bacterium]